MIRVISSPSSSTTGLRTLILSTAGDAICPRRVRSGSHLLHFLHGYGLAAEARAALGVANPRGVQSGSPAGRRRRLLLQSAFGGGRRARGGRLDRRARLRARRPPPKADWRSRRRRLPAG